MQGFTDFLEETDVDYLIVDIPESLLNDSLLEGRWINSGKKGY